MYVTLALSRKRTFNGDSRFRWVSCQIDCLRKCVKLSGLRKALKTLPKDSDETCARILSSIDEEYVADAIRILQ